jgi:hypothetical protein
LDLAYPRTKALAHSQTNQRKEGTSNTQGGPGSGKMEAPQCFRNTRLSTYPRKFNPYLSKERKHALHTHLTQISVEYAQMELEEIRLLKVRALPEGFDCQRTTLLSSINKDYELLVKDEEDPSEDSSEEC